MHDVLLYANAHTADAKPKYLSKIDNNIDMFREIESIIDQEANCGMQAQVRAKGVQRPEG